MLRGACVHASIADQAELVYQCSARGASIGGCAARSIACEKCICTPNEDGRDDEAQQEQHAEQYGFLTVGADRPEQAEQWGKCGPRCVTANPSREWINAREPEEDRAGQQQRKYELQNQLQYR